MKLAKIFAEVRFDPSFLIDDGRTRNEIYKEMKNDFQLADHDDKRIIIFVNLKNKTKFVIYHDKIVIDIDEPQDINKIKTIGGNYIPFILKRFETTSTERIGVRAQYVYEKRIDNLKQSKLIAESLFHPNLVSFINDYPNLIDIAPKIGYSININHELVMNVGIGLQNMVSGQALNNNNDIILNIDDTKPITDLDIYTTVKKEPSQIHGVLKVSCDHIENYLTKIWGLVNQQ